MTPSAPARRCLAVHIPSDFSTENHRRRNLPGAGRARWSPLEQLANRLQLPAIRPRCLPQGARRSRRAGAAIGDRRAELVRAESGIHALHFAEPGGDHHHHRLADCDRSISRAGAGAGNLRSIAGVPADAGNDHDRQGCAGGDRGLFPSNADSDRRGVCLSCRVSGKPAVALRRDVFLRAGAGGRGAFHFVGQ